MMDKKEQVIREILQRMEPQLDEERYTELKSTLYIVLHPVEITEAKCEVAVPDSYNEMVLKQYYGAMLVEGKSQKTLVRYKLAIDMLLDFFHAKTVKEITTNDLRYYLALYQQQRHVSNTTLDGMRRIFSAFFNWLEQEDYIYKSPARRVARIKKDTKKERELYESEIELLAQACTNIRDRALLEFMYATAARVSEVAAVDISDIDFEHREVLLHGKGGKDRTAYFTDKAALFLRQYLRTRQDDNGALFVSLKNPTVRVTKDSIEQMVRQLGRRSGLTGIHPHRFRVTRITVLVNRGMPLQDVQVLAGHVSINTTQMYYRANHEKVRFEYNRVA
jgi:site-specific recombinase XerD